MGPSDERQSGDLLSAPAQVRLHGKPEGLHYNLAEAPSCCG
jgi:hypothetical protein